MYEVEKCQKNCENESYRCSTIAEIIGVACIEATEAVASVKKKFLKMKFKKKPEFLI